MIATDRISAFDTVLPHPIPYKGQVLNEISSFFLEQCRSIVPIWFIASPDKNVAVGYQCQPIKIEMVVRGYLAGHAWRQYQQGRRWLCGNHLPEGLRENDPLPKPIITPTTKAHTGHDEDIDPQQIIAEGLADESTFQQLEAYALRLFALGSQYAESRDLILVDTKYEFGWYQNQIMLIDEVHTADSSRYFYRHGYAERQATGQPQKQLSKEFVRQWLLQHDFMGKAGQQVPPMSEAWIHTISQRYIELYQQLLGRPFIGRDESDTLGSIEHNVVTFMEQLWKH